MTSLASTPAQPASTPAQPASTQPLPLAGITIVEFCHSVAGPYGASILADLGADVIKIENPGKGDHGRGWGPPYWHGTSSLFQTLNRNKRGIVVDLRDPAQCAQIKAWILEHADVVIQNLRPGAIGQYGLSGAELLAAKPSLIYCNLGAFGATGPLREKPGYDPLMQAQGGIMSVTGEEHGGPVRVGTSIVDMGAGMWAAIGVQAALLRRAATGAGCIVDTSLFETAVAWMHISIAGYLASGQFRGRMGSGTVEIVPHQAFKAADGHVMIAAGNDGLFQKLATALGRPELGSDERFATNGGRVTHRAVLVPLLESIIGTATVAQWRQRLDAAGVPSAPIQNIAEVVADEQTAALGLLQKAPDLDMTLVGLPLSFDGVRPPYRRSAPRQGEHTTELFGAPVPPSPVSPSHS